MKVENIEDIYRLTPIQQEILRRELKSPGSLPVRLCSYLLDGDLNVTAFEQIWQRILRQHQALRVLFSWENLNEPLQVVLREVVIPLEWYDWSTLPASEQEHRMEQFLTAEREVRFDLRRSPPLRVHLIRMTVKTHYFVWSYHGLLLDRRSQQIILMDLFACYDAICDAREFKSKHTYIYKDYFAWLKRQELTDAKEFWTDALPALRAPDSLSIHPLPGNHSRDQEEEIELSTNTCAALRAFAQRHQLSIRTILSGIWALLLGRYIDSTEIVFGICLSDRPSSWPGGELAVGAFSNFVPVRVEITAGATVISWLNRLQDQYIETNRFEHIPLAKIRDWSDVEPDQSLFESALAFNDYEHTLPLPWFVRDITIRRHHVDIKNDYPTVLEVSESPQFVLRLAHDGSTFQREAMGRTLGYLKTLIETVITGSEQRLSNLSLLTEEEQRQLLAVGDAISSAVPLRCTLSEMFEAQVDRAPERIAIVLGDEVISYCDLNERANQLAHRLRGLGVGPEVTVGVCANRSIATVVSLLGILKAGGVYVPLDPKSPQERLSYMLTDTGPSVLLIEQHLIFNLPASAVASEIICLDSDWGGIAQESTVNLESCITGMNLAYVIYTSGSTGSPKGVCISHEAAVNHLARIGESFALQSNDRMLQFASLSFDVSIEQILATLFSGATLVLRDEQRWETTDFYHQVERYGITVANVPPAYWTVLTREFTETHGLETQLRLIIVGGDAMPIATVRQWLQSAMGSSRLLNAYGPTETTITSTLFDVPPHYGEQDSVTRVPIGRPLAGRAIYILDRQGNLKPLGTRGELCIGGPLLARGYLNDTEQTAEKFVPDPFSLEPGARFYRTGDIARFQEDEQIEFLGRMDHQVKIRGFRIELAEIETALCSSPAIKAAVVAAREESGGDKRLVAYVVPRQSAWGGELIDELRDALKQRLPDYMIPSTFVRLDELPMTPSGKVDRRALPLATRTFSESDDHYVAPRTPVEKALVEILTEVLGGSRVGVYDNFFQLGGHSLLAAQVVSRLRERFRIEVSLSTFFEKPVVAELAKEIEVAGAMAWNATSPIPPIDRNQDLSLSFAQQRLWFLDQLAPGSTAYNSSGVIHLIGQLDLSPLEQSLGEIIRRHEALRTTIDFKDGRPVQIINEALDITLQIEDLSGLPESEREAMAEQLAIAEARKPVDLRLGPLARFRLLRLEGERHMLLVTLPHIISDGWSIGVFVRELATLYEAFVHERPSPLPELSIQFADYAAWEREQMNGIVFDRQLSYWKEQLADAPLVLELPSDRQRPLVQSFKGAAYYLDISHSLTEAIKTLSSREETTMFMTLLASFAVLLSYWSSEEDLLIGTDVANRNRLESEALIGLFVNQLVLRVRIRKGQNFDDLLRQVKETTLGAYAHQDLPFDKLVEVLRPERDLGRNPLFQVMFGLRNAQTQFLEAGDLKLQLAEFDNSTSVFDLSLYMIEAEAGMIGKFRYNTELFDASTIKRIGLRLKTLLHIIAARSAVMVDELFVALEEDDRQERLQNRSKFAAARRKMLKGVADVPKQNK